VLQKFGPRDVSSNSVDQFNAQAWYQDFQQTVFFVYSLIKIFLISFLLVTF
jgi:hypothetical protein